MCELMNEDGELFEEGYVAVAKFKAEFRSAAKRAGFSDAQIEDYIKEAEHQDGDGYWLNFMYADQAVDDLKLYYGAQ